MTDLLRCKCEVYDPDDDAMDRCEADATEEDGYCDQCRVVCEPIHRLIERRRERDV